MKDVLKTIMTCNYLVSLEVTQPSSDWQNKKIVLGFKKEIPSKELCEIMDYLHENETIEWEVNISYE